MVAACLVGAMQLGAWQSGLLHAHVDDHDTPHHHGRVVHAHFSDHVHPAAPHSGRASMYDDDSEHAVALQLFVAVAPAAFEVPALPEHSFTVNETLTAAVRRPPLVAHSHDPPDVSVLAPRAPPAADLT